MQSQNKINHTVELHLLRIIYAIQLFFILTSCEKAVEVNPPATSLVSTTVFSSNSTAAAAVTSIYDRMVAFTGFSSGSISISFRCGLAADELKNYSSNATLSKFYTNSLNNTIGYDTWAEFYKYIYSTNAAIEGLNASTSISASIKQQLLGESKFLRAFFYFYMVNLYGDVPLVTTTDYTVNNVIGRTPKDQIFKQIITDLKDAQNLLNVDFYDPSGNATIERVRPNKGAATALLARVYLYIGNWADAETQASLILNNASYKLISDINTVFLKNSFEAIWQLQPVNPNYNTYDGFQFIRTSASFSLRPVTLSTNLLNEFETGDNRKSNWVGVFSANGISYYYPYKYKVQGGNGGPVKEYLMVLRLAEQYLIRAEARANQNNIAGSQEDINVIRNRAGLTNTTANDKQSLLSAIYHERKVELFTEWGHRWFDLKRTGNVDAIMSIVTPQKGGNWNSNWALFPIPQSEILINHNLTQNPGY